MASYSSVVGSLAINSLQICYKLASERILKNRRYGEDYLRLSKYLYLTYSVHRHYEICGSYTLQMPSQVTAEHLLRLLYIPEISVR